MKCLTEVKTEKSKYKFDKYDERRSCYIYLGQELLNLIYKMKLLKRIKKNKYKDSFIFQSF